MEKLLEHRRIVKKKKPIFSRQDAHKKAKLKPNWRRPKGSDSKMRVSRKGYRRCVSKGWGSPVAVNGFSKEGMVIVHIANLSDLTKVDPKKECIIILSSVGLKNRLKILEEAVKKSIVVTNLKDASGFIEQKKKLIDDKKKSSETKKKSRQAKKEKVEKEAEKVKKKEDEDKKKEFESKTDKDKKAEDKKTEEKKEKDKVLIQK